MSQALTCTIPSASVSYKIVIKNGLLSDPQAFLPLCQGKRVVIITHDSIQTLYGNALKAQLRTAGLETFLFSFPSGEAHKTQATKELLENQLFEKGLGRDTCILAMGGGVVTDLGGFLAATYCRGVPLLTIPTSLLGMVDASIGGKTGVNVPQGKNLVGCIYQPKAVLIDPEVLKTLPAQELRNGFVEMIKHGLIADEQYFTFLEDNVEALLQKEPALIKKAIAESCRIKKTIVEQDEKESGKRCLLNYGHTVGHALENLSNYSLPHGEAVALGLLAEGQMAVQMGKLSQTALDRTHELLKRYGLPLKVPFTCSAEAVMQAMILDKKSLKGKPRFVILEDIGSPMSYEGAFCTPVDEAIVKQNLGEIS